MFQYYVSCDLRCDWDGIVINSMCPPGQCFILSAIWYYIIMNSYKIIFYYIYFVNFV